MNVGELIEMLSAEDPAMLIVFPIAQGVFSTPCPRECGILEIGPPVPVVNAEGQLEEPVGDESYPRKMYALMPHDEEHPHE